MPAITIENLNKVYAGGLKALNDVNLEVQTGEIFALLGPNGAGKTTLISIICGITNASSGTIKVGGYDIFKDYRKSRELIGLVPQELTTDAFESVWDTVNFSRGLFGKSKNSNYIEQLLMRLSLWDKRKQRLMTLSGGMKRRVLIAKALAHEPKVLFLDEPTAGVDVELRKEMWAQVRELRESGVTIVLTTHYIDEAEEMADRVSVINSGKIILTEDKKTLMKKLGVKQLIVETKEPLSELPKSLTPFHLKVEGQQLTYCYDAKRTQNGVDELLATLRGENIALSDLHTKQSSLEEIFVELVKKR
jgi:ABC-2 type transport system ATP-binding protein